MVAYTHILAELKSAVKHANGEIENQLSDWKSYSQLLYHFTDPLCKQRNSDFIGSQHIVAADAICPCVQDHPVV
jgi:hypothetical protein